MIVRSTDPEGRFLVPYLDGAKVDGVVRADTSLGQLTLRVKSDKGRKLLRKVRRVQGLVQLLDRRTLPVDVLPPAQLQELRALLTAQQLADVIVLGNGGAIP